jgi:hypothetical protein
MNFGLLGGYSAWLATIKPVGGSIYSHRVHAEAMVEVFHAAHIQGVNLLKMGLVRPHLRQV